MSCECRKATLLVRCLCHGEAGKLVRLQSLSPVQWHSGGLGLTDWRTSQGDGCRHRDAAFQLRRVSGISLLAGRRPSICQPDSVFRKGQEG